MNNDNFRSISMNIRYPSTSVKREGGEQNHKKLNKENKYFFFSSSTNKQFSSSSLMMNNNGHHHSYFWDDLLMNNPSKVEELIKTIPDYYPLERTHTTVYLKNLRDIVIPNLRHCFRTLGIQVITDTDGGASLITKEYIDIHLYFWKMQKQKDDNEDTRIYLELQRRQGDSIQYHFYVRQILVAATATTILTTDKTFKSDNCNDAISTATEDKSYCSNSPATTTKFFPSPLKKKIGDYDLQDINDILSETSLLPSHSSTPSFIHLSPPQETKNTGHDDLPPIMPARTPLSEDTTSMPSAESSSSLCSIQMTIALLKSKKFDSQMLGMESLCILTDLNKTSRSVAYRISHDIIFGNKVDSSFLHTLVFKLVLLLVRVEPQAEEKERTILRQQYQSALVGKNRDVDDEYDGYYDDSCFLFQLNDNDKEDDGDDDDCDIRELLLDSFGCFRKRYRRSIEILRNYALTIVSNAWEILLLSNNNKNLEHLPTTKSVTLVPPIEVEEKRETTLMHPQFSSTVITTATKIIKRSNSNEFQQQHQHGKKDKDIIGDDIVPTYKGIIDLIIQILWKDVECAYNQPHNACLAIKSLLCLFRCGWWRQKAFSDEEQSILRQAEMIGRATNQRLELLCQTLLRQTA